jgi:hypothetical protein
MIGASRPCSLKDRPDWREDMDQDEAARRAKAKRLREQIRDIVGPSKAETSADVDRPEACNDQQVKPSDRRAKESPRDFIHRRMRELAGTKKNG